MSNLRIDILPNLFLKEDGTFDKENAIDLCGKIAGICYDQEGYDHIKNEDKDKTNKRIKRTLGSGHHSVYDHVLINFNIHNIPKILAMIINNEKQYTTSEKSARYTKITRNENSLISEDEEYLYNKWLINFENIINKYYGQYLTPVKIKKLAQENARYLVTVFMPTEMVYSTTLRQINYIVSWFKEYINSNTNTKFDITLIEQMKHFINELDRLNVLVPELQMNEKHRKISLFGQDLNKKQEYFGDIYITNYKATFADLAQAQRHRTINYKMEFLPNKEYFVPPILEDTLLKQEWLKDIEKLNNITIQGQLININEMGTYDNFILKCKERLCSEAQLEIMMQTKETLLKYKDTLEKSNHYLKDDIKLYCNGARCTFPDYKCLNDCKFKEGKTLTRKI